MPRTPLRTTASMVSALLLVTLLPLVAAQSAAAQERSAPTTRLIVLFKPGVARSTQTEVSGAEGTIVRDLSFIRARVIEIPTSIERVIRKRLARRSDVLAVEADLPVRSTALPNEPMYRSTSADGRASVDILDSVAVPSAWDTTTGSTGVVLAVLDTGVTPLSSDLATGRFVTGYNALTGRTGSTATTDDNGHGTSAASVATALGNNGSGLAGVCWTCRIMPVKVLNSSGSGTTSSVAAGINWAVSNGADVLSLSLSGGGTTTLKLAVDNAVAKGVSVIAAAGNDGRYTQNGADPGSYPAAYPAAISVGGVTSYAARSTARSNFGDWVTVAAPWTNLALNRSNQLVWFSGTSSATPMVSGIVGLLLAARSNLSPAQIRSILMRTATDHALDINDASGLVNARAGLDDALGTVGSTTTTSTSTSTSSTTTSTTTTSTTSTSTSTSTTTPASQTTTVTDSATGTVSRTLTVKAGRVVVVPCSRCTVTVLRSNGTVLQRGSRGRSVTISNIAAGSYTFRSVNSSSRSTATIQITYQA